MSKDEILQIIRDSRAKGTSSPFVGALSREDEIDKSFLQLENCLVEPFPVNVVAAYHPQKECKFINGPDVIAIAENNNEYLLYTTTTKLFAKAWRTDENQFTILGFSSTDVIAEWRG